MPYLFRCLLLLLLASASLLPAGAQSLPPAEGVPVPLAIEPEPTPPSGVQPAAEPLPAPQPAQTAVQVAPPEPPAPPLAQQEEQLRQRLAGKSFYLRSGWLADQLTFDENGQLTSHSPQGSYTLSILQIEKVHLNKRRLQIEATRYGLHFLGQLASEQSDGAVNRVRITPPKKAVRIAIDRLLVTTPKKKKPSKKDKEAKEEKQEPQPAPAEPAPKAHTTTSPAQAARLLDQTLDTLFAPELDARMRSGLPDFWQLYYAAVDSRTEYRPRDPAVLRQTQVDRKARLSSSVATPSNEYAQAAGVAGMTLYHVVVSPEGAPVEIAVARPIGFGLDEIAVEAIRKARFEPALKNGQPVPVLLDLSLQFRIYSKRTSGTAKAQPSAEALPGPYAVEQSR